MREPCYAGRVPLDTRRENAHLLRVHDGVALCVVIEIDLDEVRGPRDLGDERDVF